MPALPVITLGSSWSLIYDPAVSGDFEGGISRNGGAATLIRVDSTLPGASVGGVQLVTTLPISIAASSGDKIYGRALSDFSLVQMVDELYPDSFPPGVFEGTRAITVQGYAEANVKNGRQFYVRAAWPALGPTPDPIAANTGRKIWFKTGNEPVIVKLRQLDYVSEALRVRLFRGPTGVTGGTPLTLHNYNGINPYVPAVPPLATKNVTTATDGAEFDGNDPEWLFGASTSGNRTQNSIPQGRERILPPLTEFIVEIFNYSTGGGAASSVTYYLDFYIGQPDLPL